jgi:hypothetical protein
VGGGEGAGGVTQPAKLLAEPCPRCGCHLAHLFECGCGAVHSDYCCNCGRFTDLPREAHIELGPYDVPCEHGAVAHEHPEKEKLERLNQYLDGLMMTHRTENLH